MISWLINWISAGCIMFFNYCACALLQRSNAPPAAAAAPRTTLADVLATGPVTVVAGSPQTYGGRFGLRVLDRPDPGARAFATFKSDATLETRNARRLALAGEALAALPLTVDGDRVDAQLIQPRHEVTPLQRRRVGAMQ